MYTASCDPLRFSLSYSTCRDVHSVCSWDEKASVKIQKALETEILAFIQEAQQVGQAGLLSKPGTVEFIIRNNNCFNMPKFGTRAPKQILKSYSVCHHGESATSCYIPLKWVEVFTDHNLTHFEPLQFNPIITTSTPTI